MKTPLPLSSCAQRCRRTSLLRQRCLTRVPSTYTAPSAIASATGSATWPEESTLNVSCLACTRLHTFQVRGTLDRPARCRRAPSRAAVRSAGRGLERASAGPSSPRVEPRLVVTRRGPDVPRAAARTPSCMRIRSTTIQFAWRPRPENRPRTITRSPSTMISSVSCLNVAGRLRTSANSPSRPGVMCALCWRYSGDQNASAAA